MHALSSSFRGLAFVTVTSFAFLATAVVCSAQQSPANGYYQSAEALERWLQDCQVRTDVGLSWPTAPEIAPDSDIGLYHGNSGIILFLLAMHEATHDENENIRMLNDARGAADEIISQLPAAESSSANCGLYTGLAGIGFTLSQLANTSGDEKYKVAALRCLAIIKQSANRVNESSEDADNGAAAWNSSTDIISGTAGIGLYLLHAANEFDDDEALQLAARAGDNLLSAAESTEHGLSWKMSPDYPRDMPNFSHGTAGIAYFLCQLSQATGEEKYLKAAISGANHLLAIAKTDDDGLCVFHHSPGGEDLYYLGWCHGPPGTARLFFALEKATSDEVWRKHVQASARSLIASGIPRQRTAGFWNNHGACCGTAGVAEFFLELGLAYDEPQYLEFAQELATNTINAATKKEINGKQRMSWNHAEHRVQADNLSAQTGYMQGAAGIGILLLRMDAAKKNRAQPARLPDSPYGG